jgi:hypothetical protein
MMKFYSLIIATILLISSCTSSKSIKLALDENEWLSKTEYSVSGLNKGLFKKQVVQFGPYTTNGVKRSWTRGNSGYSGWVNTIWTKYERKEQTLRFSLTDSLKNEAEVFCINEVNARDFVVGKNENSLPNIILDIWGKGDSYANVYLVEIYMKGDPTPWTLAFDAPKAVVSNKGFIGYLQHGDKEHFKLVPISKMQTSKGVGEAFMHAAVGYEFRTALNNPVAAFSEMTKSIYLSNVPAKEKLVLASAATALMLKEII